MDFRIEEVGELAIIECEGRIVRSEATFKLLDAVLSLREIRKVLLDLSEVSTIDAEGLDMLLFLQRWASGRDIQFKLFNPILCVRNTLESTADFDIATDRETMAFLASADNSLVVAI